MFPFCYQQGSKFSDKRHNPKEAVPTELGKRRKWLYFDTQMIRNKTRETAATKASRNPTS